MRRICLALMILCLAAPAAVAAGDPGLARRLQPGLARGYPGLAMITRDRTGRVRSAAVGFADLEHGLPLKTTDAFHIGSVNKVFTAVTALQLVDQGRLSLKSTLVEVLGDLAAPISGADRITVAQLLDHSSGIYATNNNMDYLTTMLGPMADPTRVWTARELVALAYKGRNPPEGEPGTGHYYSDTNYILLSLIIAKTSGRPYKEAVRRAILVPLGMRQTWFYSDVLEGRDKPRGRQAQGYLLATKDIRDIIAINPMFKAIPGRATAKGELINTTLAQERTDGAGGLISTAPDMLKFATAVFHGKLLSPASQAYLMAAGSNVQDLPLGKHRTWTLQAFHAPFGMLVYKEGDGPGGTNALMAYRPDRDDIYVGLTNSFGHFDEVDFMIDEVIGPLARSNPLSKR